MSTTSKILFFSFFILFANETIGQSRKNQFEYYISSGLQLHKSKPNRQGLENIRTIQFPVFAGGIRLMRHITPKYFLGLDIGFYSGKISKSFDFRYLDSAKSLVYNSTIQQNFITYGIGLRYVRFINNKFSLSAGIGLNKFSSQSAGGTRDVDLKTHTLTSFSELYSWNPFNETKQFVNVNLGFNYSFGKRRNNVISISADKIFGKPIYCGHYFEFDNKIIEDNNYNLNFGKISIGLCRQISF